MTQKLPVIAGARGGYRATGEKARREGEGERTEGVALSLMSDENRRVWKQGGGRLAIAEREGGQQAAEGQPRAIHQPHAAVGGVCVCGEEGLGGGEVKDANERRVGMKSPSTCVQER